MNRPLSEQVIGCAIEVHRQSGNGFLERVYESALSIEFTRSGIQFQRQVAVPVHYRDEVVAEYCCDFLVDGCLLLEIKAASHLVPENEAQVINYLKATRLTVGLLLNFGAPRLGIRRLVMQHEDRVPI